MNMDIIHVAKCYGLKVKHWVVVIPNNKYIGKLHVRVDEEVMSVQCTYMWLWKYMVNKETRKEMNLENEMN
jgi:hypothetical protein